MEVGDHQVSSSHAVLGNARAWFTTQGQRQEEQVPGSVACDHRVVLFPLDLNSREQETCQPVHVINVDIQDNHEEATLGAFLICELCQCVSVLPLLLPHACSGPRIQECLTGGLWEQSLRRDMTRTISP